MMSQHSHQQYSPSSFRRSRRLDAGNALQLYMLDEQQLFWGQIVQTQADYVHSASPPTTTSPTVHGTPDQRPFAVQPSTTVNTIADLSHVSSHSNIPVRDTVSHASHLSTGLPDPLSHGAHRHLADSALFPESRHRYLNDVQCYNDQRPSTLGVHSSSHVGSVSSTESHAALPYRSTEGRRFDDVPDFTGLNSGTINGPGPPNRLVVPSSSRGSSSHTISASRASTPSLDSQLPVTPAHTVCDICGKGPFGRLNELRRHRATVHEPPKWVCGVCGNRFKRKDDRERHKRVLHRLLGR